MFTHAKAAAAYAQAMYLDRLRRSLTQRQQLTHKPCILTVSNVSPYKGSSSCTIHYILTKSGKHQLILLLLLTQVAGIAWNNEDDRLCMAWIP